MPGGRPKGRALTELEQRHLRHLLALKGETHEFARRADEDVEDFVLELHENGCSVRSIAAAVDIGYSSVQKWARNATRRRGGDPD